MDILRNDARVSLNGQVARMHIAGDEHATLVFDDGRTSVQPKANLYNALASNNLYFINDDEVEDPFNDSLLDEKKQAKRNRIRDYVNDLRRVPNNRSRDVIAGSINKTARRIGDEGNEPSVSAVYNWLRNADELGPNIDPGQIVSDRPEKKPDHRIPEHMERMIRDVIDDVYYTSHMKISAVYEIFRQMYLEKYKVDLKQTKLKTFHRRIADRCPIEHALHRVGPQRAREMRRAVLNDMRVNTILDQYQIDAVHLMIGIKDEQDNFIGYPVVHICIDVFSRAIVGISVELSGESSAGAVECFKHAFGHKNRLADHPYTKNDWIMYGKPFEIGNDGGSAYMAAPVGQFLRIMNITRQAAQTRTGWLKGVVERFNDTLRMRFAEHMKGYLGKKDYDREVDADMKKHAYHTLESFKQDLTRYIVDDYNQAPHSHHLGRSPHNVWNEMAMTRVPEEPSELKHAQHFYGNWRKPTFSHPNGLRIKYITYNSNELTKLYWELEQESTDGKVKMLTLHNPLDISQVSVLAGDKLYVVPATRSDVPIRVGMSQAEYLAKRKAANDKAEKENEGSEAHVDFGAFMHKQRSQSSESDAKTDSGSEDTSNQEAPKRQRKNKRPQTPLGDMDNSYHAVQAASAQGIDTSPPTGPVEAGPDDEINMNPFSSYNLNGGTDHE